MAVGIQWRQLPQLINHAEYTFRLQYRNFADCWYVGYFVSACHSRKPYKKLAFSLDYWTDNSTKYHTSSVGTPLLTGIPLFSDNDIELAHSLQTLYRYLIQNFGYASPITVANAFIDTEYEEIRPLSIKEFKQL